MSKRSHDPLDKYTRKVNLPVNGNGEEEDDCSSFTLTTILQKIDQLALDKIAKGDILKVELATNDTVVVINKQGDICGSIAHPKSFRLSQCLKNNFKFQATVLEVNIIMCEVFIKSSLNF